MNFDFHKCIIMTMHYELLYPVNASPIHSIQLPFGLSGLGVRFFGFITTWCLLKVPKLDLGETFLILLITPEQRSGSLNLGQIIFWCKYTQKSFDKLQKDNIEHCGKDNLIWSWPTCYSVTLISVGSEVDQLWIVVCLAPSLLETLGESVSVILEQSQQEELLHHSYLPHH